MRIGILLSRVRAEEKLLIAACERLGCAPNETLYVGDSPIADFGGAETGVHGRGDGAQPGQACIFFRASFRRQVQRLASL